MPGEAGKKTHNHDNVNVSLHDDSVNLSHEIEIEPAAAGPTRLSAMPVIHLSM